MCGPIGQRIYLPEKIAGNKAVIGKNYQNPGFILCFSAFCYRIQQTHVFTSNICPMSFLKTFISLEWMENTVYFNQTNQITILWCSL